MSEFLFLERAILLAKWAHNGQMRKWGGPIYFSHCEAVAEMVKIFTDDGEGIAASYLHDVVEDTKVSLRAITHQFGHRVGGIVESLTNVEVGNRKTRKRLGCERLAKACAMAQTIKCADIIDNCNGMAGQCDEKEFTKLYLQEKGRCLEDALTKAHPKILQYAKFIVQREYDIVIK